MLHISNYLPSTAILVKTDVDFAEKQKSKRTFSLDHPLLLETWTMVWHCGATCLSLTLSLPFPLLLLVAVPSTARETKPLVEQWRNLFDASDRNDIIFVDVGTFATLHLNLLSLQCIRFSIHCSTWHLPPMYAATNETSCSQEQQSLDVSVDVKYFRSRTRNGHWHCRGQQYYGEILAILWLSINYHYCYCDIMSYTCTTILTFFSISWVRWRLQKSPWIKLQKSHSTDWMLFLYFNNVKGLTGIYETWHIWDLLTVALMLILPRAVLFYCNISSLS